MAAREPGFGSMAMDHADPAERRRALRIDAAIRATVRLAEIADSSISRARAVDISDSGVRLLLRRRLPTGARVLVDMECELPLRVHLGYDAHSLVVDGPMHTHVVRIAGRVTRQERMPNRLFQIGVEFCPDTTRFDELQVMRFYVDHLRGEQDSWTI